MITSCSAIFFTVYCDIFKLMQIVFCNMKYNFLEFKDSKTGLLMQGCSFSKKSLLRRAHIVNIAIIIFKWVFVSFKIRTLSGYWGMYLEAEKYGVIYLQIIFVKLTHPRATWTKWTPFRRRYFQTHFIELKVLYFFVSKFHWSLFLRVQLTITQHWFREWLGAE